MNRQIGATIRVVASPEYAFALIGLFFGLLIVYVNPPFQSNDEDRHFYNSYLYSTGQSPTQQNGDQIGGFLPINLFNTVVMYQALPFNKGAKVSKGKLDESMRIPLNESRVMFFNNPNYNINPIPYIPFIFGIHVAKAFNSNPIYLLWGARIAGLMSFLIVGFIAIRIIPILKYGLVAVALSPMTLYQATSVSYDVLSVALSFLLIAMVLRFAFSERAISTRELALFLMIAVLHRYTKDGYFLIPFVLFLIPISKFGSIKRALAVFATLCVIYFLPRVTWEAYLSSLHLHGGAALIKDYLYDPGKQIEYYRHQPLQFLRYLLLNVGRQGLDWIIGALGRFGYAYSVLTVPVVFIHGIALITFSVFDSSTKHTITIRQKLIIACVGFGTIAVLVIGFFLLSPVGAHVIFGLQGRYFIQVLPLLMLLNYNSYFRSTAWEKWKSVIVPSYCAVLLSYTVYFINDYFYTN